MGKWNSGVIYREYIYEEINDFEYIMLIGKTIEKEKSKGCVWMDGGKQL